MRKKAQRNERVKRKNVRRTFRKTKRRVDKSRRRKENAEKVVFPKTERQTHWTFSKAYRWSENLSKHVGEVRRARKRI